MFHLPCVPEERAVFIPTGSQAHVFCRGPPLPSRAGPASNSSPRLGESEQFLTLISSFVLVSPQKHYFPINYRVSVPYEGVLRMANITRLVRIPPLEWGGPRLLGHPVGPAWRHIGLGRSCCQGSFLAPQASLPLAQAPGAPPTSSTVDARGLPPVQGKCGGRSELWGAGPEAPVWGFNNFSCPCSRGPG